MDRLALEDVWPLFRLRLRYGNIELRPADDSDTLALGRIVHDVLTPETAHHMPNLSKARAGTVEETARNVLRHAWRRRAALSPEDWAVPFAVVLDGVVVGMQAIQAVDFRTLRDVHTGSYLAAQVRGAGVGTLMRAMVVEFAFAHLDASTVSSGYALTNTSSRRVSEKLGYLPDGITLDAHEGVRYTYQRVRMDRDRWLLHRPAWLDELDVADVEGAAALLGLT